MELEGQSNSQVTGMSTEAECCGGWVAIQGTEMAALHVYLPPSEERTGLKERVRVDDDPLSEPKPLPPEPLPEPLPLPDPLPLSADALLTSTDPSGPTHSTERSRFIPSITITVQVKT